MLRLERATLMHPPTTLRHAPPALMPPLTSPLHARPDVKFGVLRPVSGVYFLSVFSVYLPVWLTWLGCQLRANDGKDYGLSTLGSHQSGVQVTSSSSIEMPER